MSETFYGPDFTLLQKQDPDIAAVLLSELKRQQTNLQLIASENFTSRAVLATLGSTLSNKYAEGYPGKRYYGGCEEVDKAEEIAIHRAKSLFGAEHANVQPHSGASANVAVYQAFTKPGDTVLAMSLPHGGHLTHGSKVNFSGKWFNVVSYGVRQDNELIDYDELRELAITHKPKMICSGATAYPSLIDFEKVRAICDEVGAIMWVDAAHFIGLVAGKAIPSPVPCADVVSFTTHKVLRGPRGGMILSKAEHAAAIDKAVFPGMQGGPIMSAVAGKAVALAECATPAYQSYARDVIVNAKALAAALEAETAAAAEEAKKKVLSEEEAKTAVTSATTEVEATRMRIQTDQYYVSDSTEKIQVLSNSLANVDKDSKTYADVQATIASLTEVKNLAESRMANNLALQQKQKQILSDLSSLQNNAVKVNAAAAAEILNSTRETQKSITEKASEAEQDVTNLTSQITKIDDLLGRISKDSPDYTQLLAAKEALSTTLTQVAEVKQKLTEEAVKTDQVVEQTKEATLPSRVEALVLGKVLAEDEKPEVPTFKVRKVSSKYAEVRTKLLDDAGDAGTDVKVAPEELDGAKVVLRSGKTQIKVNKINLNEDGTISFKIPRTAKSGTYTMTVDLPDTDNDVTLKVKINNN